MNNPQDFNAAVAAEIGRLRLSEIEASLIVATQSAEIERLTADNKELAAKVKGLTTDKKPGEKA